MNVLKYTLDTTIRFGINLSGVVEEDIETLEEMGFTQDELDSKDEEQIEKEIQEMYENWQANYLDAGWAVVKD